MYAPVSKIMSVFKNRDHYNAGHFLLLHQMKLFFVQDTFSKPYGAYLTPIKLDLIYGEVSKTSLFVLDRNREKVQERARVSKKKRMNDMSYVNSVRS